MTDAEPPPNQNPARLLEGPSKDETLGRLSDRTVAFGHELQTILKVTGPDRFEWLQGVLTCDVLGNTRGAFWGLFLNRLGKIRGEVVGVSSSGTIYLAVLGGKPESLVDHLDSLLVMEDVEIQISDEQEFWSLHGHDSERVARQIAASVEIAHAPVAWISSSDTVAVVAKDAHLRERLSGMDIQVGDIRQWEAFRLEHGVPRFDVDYDANDTPHRAGLYGRTVASDKGCFLGQEVVCTQQMRGAVRERSVPIVFAAGEIPRIGATVRSADGQRELGSITSAEKGSDGRVYALGRLHVSGLSDAAEVSVTGISGKIVLGE